MVSAIIAYVLLVAAAGAAAAFGWWLVVGLSVVAAVALAMRYECRWALDHTKLTKHAPRPVPKRPVGSRRA
jgi:hypothetical protein